MPPAEQTGMEASMDAPLSVSELREAINRLNVEMPVVDLLNKHAESISEAAFQSWKQSYPQDKYYLRKHPVKTLIHVFSGGQRLVFSLSGPQFSQEDFEGNLLQSFFWHRRRYIGPRRDLDNQRYSGSQLSEWRTSVIQAADRPTRLAKVLINQEEEVFTRVFISFIKLAVKGGKWCTESTCTDLKKGFSQRDLVVEVPKAFIRLACSVFEAAAEAYLSKYSPMLEGPFASTLESLISISFELVTVIYTTIMRKPSPQPADDDTLRKSCQELLNLTYRLVHIFRREVSSMHPDLINNSENGESSPGSRWLHLPTKVRIVASSLQNFAELGKLATSSGEISFPLLNTSWKSVMALLQVEEGRDTVESVVDIPSIVTTLISDAVQATKRAVETWLQQSSNSGQKDLRKLCIPIKFFLMTALKISSYYPHVAVGASRAIVSCASKVYACLLQTDLIAHKATAEAFAELVVPSAFALVQNLLNGQNAHQSQILRDITTDTDGMESSEAIADLDGRNDRNDIVDELFCDKPALRPGAGLLKTGRVVLFLSILRSSCGYNRSLLSYILSKLPWLLDEIPEEGTYLLMTQTVYLPDGRSDMSGKWKWQLMFPWVSHAIEHFAAVATKHEPIWTEFKYFLFDHVLHPSVLCGELVLDVWCFIIRQSDSQLAQDHVDILLSVLQELVSLKAEVNLQRRLARAVCVLLQVAPDTVTARVCDALFPSSPFNSPVAAGVIAMLLQEGLPLSKTGCDRLLSSCIACGKGLNESLRLESRGLDSRLPAQKPALICLPLLLCQSAFRGESTEDKYLEDIKQITLNLISMYTLDRNNSRMFHKLEIIGPTLELIPHVQHLLDPTVFKALLPRLLEIYQTTAETYNSRELKQSLPEFLANLSEVVLQEDENNPAMTALWGLYHLVLSEQAWPLVHMGLQSFAHFAAHTSCQELWRYVPPDSAAPNGNGEDDGFMTALKAFIEKECALLSLGTSNEELQVLRTECSLQQQKHKDILDRLSKRKAVDDIGNQQTKKLATEPPSGSSDIQEAVAMLCKGIGVLKDRAPEMLRSEASPEWEVFRAQLAEMNEQLEALQRRDKG